MKATIFNPNSIREGYIAWDPNAKNFKYRDGNKIRIFDDTTANAEPYLGLPAKDGQILSSTIAGVRTWIDALAEKGGIAHSATTDYVVGDIVTEAGKVYSCKTTHSAKAFDATEWDEVGGGGTTPSGLEKVGGTIYPVRAITMTSTSAISLTARAPELGRGVLVILSGGVDAPEKVIIKGVKIISPSLFVITFSRPHPTHSTHTTIQRVAEPPSWKLIDNPTTVLKDGNVNLMPTGAPTQESVTEVEGVKYKSYTTAEIAALPDYTLGTFLFDSTLNSLVQCTDATPGANVWKAIGGSATGAVTSFNTRTGAVVPASGDYDIPKIIGLQPALDAKAPIASPTFTGVARAETAGAGTNTTQIATTAFVKRDFVDIGGDTMTGNLAINTAGPNNFSLTSSSGKSIAMGIAGSPPEFSIVGSSSTPYQLVSYDSSGTIQSALTFKTNGNLSLIGDSDADVTPADDKDLATKKYVDDNTGGITEQPAIPDLPDLTSTPTDAEFDDIINKINTTLATLRTAGIIAT